MNRHDHGSRSLLGKLVVAEVMQFGWFDAGQPEDTAALHSAFLVSRG